MAADAEALTADPAYVLQQGWGMAADEIAEVTPRWFTGKVIARCHAGGREWCLAGSPEIFRARITTATRFQERLTASGCSVLPAIMPTGSGEMVHLVGGRVWCLTAWLDGRPEHSQERWTPRMLEQLGRAVGEMHRIGRELVRNNGICPAAPERFWAGDWSAFEACAGERWVSLTSDPEVVGAPELLPLRECIEIGLETLPRLDRAEVRRRTVTHDDLWTEHILFSADGRLTGLIDLDGLDVGDAVGDLAALLSDFARLEPEACRHVLQGYRAEVEVEAADLQAALATVIRHHLLTLLERIRLWKDLPDRRRDLIDPVGYWLRSLRHAAGLDRYHWVDGLMSSARS